MRAVFWVSSLLLVWAQAGYGVFLALLARRRAPAVNQWARPNDSPVPEVSLVVAAYKEEAVIADKVANALALDWPRDRLEVIVAVDGDADATAATARRAGADVVLELPRGGKMRAQDAAVRAARGEILLFSDANTMWAHDAARHLVAAFADPAVAYACGEVTFTNAQGTNQEGVYWRYEMWMRAHESALASITAGNGGIYAVRAADYIAFDPPMGHDMALPPELVRRGRRAVYVPAARASEPMVPDIAGESARKRRMMSRVWRILRISRITRLHEYEPLYATMLFSHRLLRYASPFLHLAALVASARSPRRLERAAFAAQLAILAAAATGGPRPALIARYYVATTAAIAAGLYDHLRHGTPEGWEPAAGTR